MAKFKTAFEKTMQNEGFYSNDPNDPGGETCFGISRVYHPEWRGWKLIDEYAKTDTDFPDFVRNLLRTYAEEFYEKEFWVKCGADRVASQLIANELFDSAVNVGVREAVKFLQMSLNLLNRNETDYQDIEVDGIFGNGTLATLGKRLKIPGEDWYLYMSMNAVQGKYYIERCLANPGKETFYRGWLERSQAKEHPKFKGKDR